MDDVWCSLDMATVDIADPFWSSFADCGGATSIGNGDACFGVVDLADIMAPSDEVEAMAADMDTSGFFAGGDARSLALHSSMSSSLSSQRSLSIDSGGSSGSYYTLDAALPANGHAASQYLAPAPAAAAPQPFTDHDEEAIMRAIMAVMSSSSASPSSSASASSPPFCRDGAQQAAVTVPEPRTGGVGCHVTVKTSSVAMSPEENAASLSGGRGRRQQEEQRTAAGNGGQQLYHMMSERKRREKLNDSFHTLRSLLPPCSKKDKTTVLSSAASYVRTLEAQVSELEEKNGKLEKHIPCGGGVGGGGARAPSTSHKRAKVQISKAAAAAEQQQVVNLTVMVMVECDVVELVLRILECLRWMEQISVLSVDADTYSPQVLLKAIASIKLRVVDVDWNEALFHETMTKAVNDATASSPPMLPLTA